MPFQAAFSSFSRFSSKLQQFDRSCNLFFDRNIMHGNSDFIKFKENWRVLKMLSESMHMLIIADVADLDGGEYLYLLALKIDAAIEEIANDLEAQETRHINKKNQQYSMSEIIRPFVSCNGTKIKRLVAEIGEALDLCLSSSSGVICCSWSFLAQSPPRPHVSLLLGVAQSVREHLHKKTPILIRDSSICEHIHVLDTELLIINNYITDLELPSSFPAGGDDDDESCKSIVDAFLSHFASMLVNFAIQFCSYMIHSESRTTSDPLCPIRLLKDSHHQIDPTNLKFMEFHVNLLIALNKNPGYQFDIVKIFSRYLIRDRGLGTRRMEVSSLIISFLSSSKIEEEDVVQIFRQEITAVLLEIAAIFEPECSGGPAIKSSERLTKFCFVMAEFCLREQIRKISYDMSSNVISNCRLEIKRQFGHILENLKRYSKDVPHEKLEYAKKTLDLVKQIHEESSSPFSIFQLKQITEEHKLKNSLLLLLLNIVLFKAESILMELSLLNKRRSSSNAAATVMNYGGKDRIAILFQLLNYFKQILSDQKLKDREDVYMPLVQIEILTREVACFYSFHPSKITEDVIRKMYVSFCEVLAKMKYLDSKANDFAPQVPLSKSPKTYKLGFIDFLVRNLGELLKYNPVFILPIKHYIEEVLLHLKSLASFLRRVSESDIDKHPELIDLYDHVTVIAYKMEYIIDSIEMDAPWHHFFWFYSLLEELRIFNNQASRIHLTTSKVAKAQESKNAAQVSPDRVVDLSDEEQLIIDQLTRGYQRRVIVSIVGMPGIGKTTMARKVYNNPNVLHHFHCQAWCTVSQVYEKRKLLLEILSGIHGLTGEIYRMNNEDLESKLRKCLLKKKYLVIMDDIWDAGVWNDIQNSFPDDDNGSRILITSRHRDATLEIEPDGNPHSLRLLSDDESWKLLDRRVFLGECCPDELLAVGKKIAHHCQGLPLAIVAIAGVLERTEKIKELWEEIAESLCTKIMEDPETRCMEIIELSYKQLPGYLKPCFLYLGVFIEDRDIQVSKLIRLWLAEGFIIQTESKNLEDVAEAYLADLISRSLVMISKTRSNGKVKACCLHDLMRDLCRSKAKDENFFQLVTRCDKPYASFPNSDYGFELEFSHHSSPIAFEAYRLSIFLKRNYFVQSRPSGPGTRSLIFFAATGSEPGRLMTSHSFVETSNFFECWILNAST